MSKRKRKRNVFADKQTLLEYEDLLNHLNNASRNMAEKIRSFDDLLLMNEGNAGEDPTYHLELKLGKSR